MYQAKGGLPANFINRRKKEMRQKAVDNMTYKDSPVFFLGANAPGGFVSHFSDVYDPEDGWRTYILKGGPGTGKSSFMKKIAEKMIHSGENVYLGACSSDFGSIDAVVIPDRKIMIADGTAPHVMEPVYPGVCEVIVNLGEYYDSARLKSAAPRIIQIYHDNKTLHQRASRYITAAGTLLADNYRIAMNATDSEKSVKFGTSLAARALGKGKGSGKESLRFLSAVTPSGHVFLSDTLNKMCSKIYAVDDEYGAASRMIMSSIRSTALKLGHDIITCPCPFAPKEKIEHIIVPEVKTAFVTVNRWIDAEPTERVIHSSRFTDIGSMRSKKQRMTFNRKASNELIIAAGETLAQAKAVHDKLEGFYIDAMDFAKVDDRCDRLISDILDSFN